MADDARPPSRQANAPEMLERLERARRDAGSLVEDLRAELIAIGESTETNPDDEHDAEGSTVGYERARVRGLLERAERSLADVDAALARIRAGTYGTCTDCGHAIPPERLAALPTTARCAACAACAAPGGPSPYPRRERRG